MFSGKSAREREREKPTFFFRRLRGCNRERRGERKRKSGGERKKRVGERRLLPPRVPAGGRLSSQDFPVLPFLCFVPADFYFSIFISQARFFPRHSPTPLVIQHNLTEDILAGILDVLQRGLIHRPRILLQLLLKSNSTL